MIIGLTDVHESFFAESSLPSDITATKPNEHPADRDHYLPSPAPRPRQTARSPCQPRALTRPVLFAADHTVMLA